MKYEKGVRAISLPSVFFERNLIKSLVEMCRNVINVSVKFVTFFLNINF